MMGVMAPSSICAALGEPEAVQAFHLPCPRRQIGLVHAECRYLHQHL
jgi:hypothetical protein